MTCSGKKSANFLPAPSPPVPSCESCCRLRKPGSSDNESNHFRLIPLFSALLIMIAQCCCGLTLSGQVIDGTSVSITVCVQGFPQPCLRSLQPHSVLQSAGRGAEVGVVVVVVVRGPFHQLSMTRDLWRVYATHTVKRASVY